MSLLPCESESAIPPSWATRYLRATECVVEQSEENALDVYVPRAPSDDQARREVAIYVQAWQAMNPQARADIVA